MMKFGFKMGLAMGSVAAMALMQKSKINRAIKKLKNK